MRTKRNAANKTRSGWFETPKRPESPEPPTEKKTRQGIQRKPRTRIAQDLPVSERHQQILALLTRTPRSARDIAAALQFSKSGTTSSLYALADRGLVERIAYRGWVRK